MCVKDKVSKVICGKKIMKMEKQFSIEIIVELKAGMLDPEGITIKKSLKHLGIETESVKTSKRYIIDVKANSEDNAIKKADEMCQKIIANPLIHDYSIKLSDIKIPLETS